jgi:FkbM family methyltransferase
MLSAGRRLGRSGLLWWRYRNIHRYVLRCGDATVRFSLDDWHSKTWFLPRYDNGRIHEPVVTALIAVLLRKAAAFVDVGTHVGYFACIASTLLGESGKVFAFEMDSRSHALARRNLELNRCGNARLLHGAVSDHDGVVTYRRPRRWSGAGLSIASTRGKEQVSVSCVALDGVLRNDLPTPAVIKIDVEGAEGKVLGGMSDILALPHVQLLVEVHAPILRRLGSSEAQVIGVLRDAGYKVFWVPEFRLSSLKQWTELDPTEVLPPNTFVYATRDAPPPLAELAAVRIDSATE